MVLNKTLLARKMDSSILIYIITYINQEITQENKNNICPVSRKRLRRKNNETGEIE